MLAGVSGDRIGQWARWGHIRSSRSEREPRVYSYEDVAEAMIVHELEELGADLPSIRRRRGAPARTPARRLAAAAQPGPAGSRERLGRQVRGRRGLRPRRTQPEPSRASWRRPTCAASPPSSSAAAGRRASSPEPAPHRGRPDRLGGRAGHPGATHRRAGRRDARRHGRAAAGPARRLRPRRRPDRRRRQLVEHRAGPSSADGRAHPAPRREPAAAPRRRARGARDAPRAHRAPPDAPTTDTGLIRSLDADVSS